MEPQDQQLQPLAPLIGERLDTESDAAVIACNDYLQMPYRSLRRLHERYVEERSRGVNVPSARYPTIARWSKAFGWTLRASAYDARSRAEQDARAHYIMHSGLAQPHERVLMLDRMARRMETEFDKGRFWLRRRKSIKTEDGYEVVNERIFNGSMLEQTRGMLDDIARETGGRKERLDINVTGLAGLFAGAPNFTQPRQGASADIEDAKVIEEYPDLADDD